MKHLISLIGNGTGSQNGVWEKDPPAPIIFPLHPEPIVARESERLGCLDDKISI